MFFRGQSLETKKAEEQLSPVLKEINTDPDLTAKDWARILVLGLAIA